MDENSLLDVRGAAALLGISPGTLYHWLSEGRVPCVRLGSRCVRFKRTDLEAWVSQKTVGTNEMQTARRNSTFRGVPKSPPESPPKGKTYGISETQR